MNRLLRKNFPGEYIVVSKNGVRLSNGELRTELIGRCEDLLGRSAISINCRNDIGTDLKPKDHLDIHS